MIDSICQRCPRIECRETKSRRFQRLLLQVLHNQQDPKSGVRQSIPSAGNSTIRLTIRQITLTYHIESNVGSNHHSLDVNINNSSEEHSKRYICLCQMTLDRTSLSLVSLFLQEFCSKSIDMFELITCRGKLTRVNSTRTFVEVVKGQSLISQERYILLNI